MVSADDSPDPFADALPLLDARRQARGFGQSRRARQTEIAEDYVELVADLIDATGEARVTDLATRLGVTHATVAKHLNRLQSEGLITSKPYRSIFLTDAGRALAEESRRRHRIVMDFLLAIGVDEETARLDSEGIEHHVSQETLDAFERVIEARRRT